MVQPALKQKFYGNILNLRLQETFVIFLFVSGKSYELNWLLLLMLLRAYHRICLCFCEESSDSVTYYDLYISLQILHLDISKSKDGGLRITRTGKNCFNLRPQKSMY